MNGKHFPLVLLLLTMLVGQMATNAHMIDHIAIAAIDCDTPSSHSENDHHEGHHHATSGKEEPSSDKSQSDCSLYHAYAGVHGIAPTAYLNNEFLTKSLTLAPSTCAQTVALTFKANPIRGPPLHS